MEMVYCEHQDPIGFLMVAQETLERHEPENGVMLGVSLRLVENPLAYGSRPYLATVESGGSLVLAAVMTPPHNLQLLSMEEGGQGLGLVVEALARGNWAVPGILAEEALAERFAALWREKTGEVYRTAMRMRTYELRSVAPLPLPPGQFRPANPEENELVRQWAYDFHDECFADDRHDLSIQGVEAQLRDWALYLWVDGAPRSMAGRTRPTPHGESIGPVYTPPDQRRKGYATALVASLSQKILDDGKEFCTLHTDLKNSTSNSIYQRIGYGPVADVVTIEFVREEDRPPRVE